MESASENAAHELAVVHHDGALALDDRKPLLPRYPILEGEHASFAHRLGCAVVLCQVHTRYGDSTSCSRSADVKLLLRVRYVLGFVTRKQSLMTSARCASLNRF
jgi:hypothetical protein